MPFCLQRIEARVSLLMIIRRDLLLIATSFLLVGVLVYVLDRPTESTYLLPGWLSISSMTGGFFGVVGNQLPTFVHVYAFILLTAAGAVPAVSGITPVCLGWFALDSLLEIAQMEPIAHWIAMHTPDWFAGIPLLENTAGYFLAGTFDVLDLASIAAGTLAAYLTFKLAVKHE